jgi:hypothetical protein
MFAASVQQHLNLLFTPVRTRAAISSTALAVFTDVSLYTFADSRGVHRRVGRHRINIARDGGSSVVGPEVLDAGILWYEIDPLHILKYSVFVVPGVFRFLI